MLILNILFDLFLPELCSGCRRNYIRKLPFCPDCTSKLPGPDLPRCLSCGTPGPAQLCHSCSLPGRILNRLHFLLPYRRDGIKLLKMAKFQKNKRSLSLLQDLLQLKMKELPAEFRIIPVPSGNQLSTRLARDLSVCSSQPVEQWLQFREKKPVRNKSLNLASRYRHAAEKFRLSGSIPPAFETRLLLIDDVWTTGASIRSCAELLHRHGFRNIEALVAFRRDSRRELSFSPEIPPSGFADPHQTFQNGDI